MVEKNEEDEMQYIAECRYCGDEFRSYSAAMALKKLGKHADTQHHP